jgi:Domain of unknown function (DUF4321)
MAKNAAQTLGMILLGGILGGYLGELMGLLVPAGFLHDLFVRGFTIGFDPPLVLNLRIITLTLGFRILLNLPGILGMIAGLYYSR